MAAVNGFDFFFIFFIIMSLLPVVRQRQIALARMRLIRQLERRRGTRVITLIHRQEMISLLGLPLSRYINIEDSEQVLRAIRLTPPDRPIDVILHTPGGLVLAAEQIARALSKHPSKVTAFIPHYAMSGGTLIALAADAMVMDENAVCGPVDPQLGEYPAVSILKAVAAKPTHRLEDRTLILADVAEKAMAQVKRTVHDILLDKMDPEKAEEIAQALTEGRWTHDYPIGPAQLAAWGLPVSTELPPEVYLLMELYPQPGQRRPSVQYVPVPYDGDRDRPRPRR